MTLTPLHPTTYLFNTHRHQRFKISACPPPRQIELPAPTRLTQQTLYGFLNLFCLQLQRSLTHRSALAQKQMVPQYSKQCPQGGHSPPSACIQQTLPQTSLQPLLSAQLQCNLSLPLLCFHHNQPAAALRFQLHDDQQSRLLCAKACRSCFTLVRTTIGATDINIKSSFCSKYIIELSLLYPSHFWRHQELKWRSSDTSWLHQLSNRGTVLTATSMYCRSGSIACQFIKGVEQLLSRTVTSNTSWAMGRSSSFSLSSPSTFCFTLSWLLKRNHPDQPFLLQVLLQIPDLNHVLLWGGYQPLFLCPSFPQHLLVLTIIVLHFSPFVALIPPLLGCPASLLSQENAVHASPFRNNNTAVNLCAWLSPPHDSDVPTADLVHF